MDGDDLYPIGDLARRTGLTVKTIRFYSDRGVVTPTGRSRAGHRLYDIEAVARLELVRTLRDLGLGLTTIRKVMDQELLLPDVAAAHALALEVQIRTLRLRHAVLTAVATRGANPEEIRLMHKLAQLSENERRHLVDSFLDAAFGGLRADPAKFAGVMRSMTPELPENSEVEHIQAWVELAELTQDPDFRRTMRRMTEDHAADLAQGDNAGLQRDLGATVRCQIEPALAAEIEPTSPQAEPFVLALSAHYARVLDSPDDIELRRRLLNRLESMNDHRRERYFQLLAVINDWPGPESLTPVLDWSIKTLSARPGR